MLMSTSVTVKSKYTINSFTFPGTFHKLVHDFAEAMDNNEVDDLQRLRTEIQEYLEELKEDGPQWWIFVDNNNPLAETSAINETDSATINMIKGRYVFWSNVAFYHNIDAVFIDMEPEIIDIRLGVISQPNKDNNAVFFSVKNAASISIEDIRKRRDFKKSGNMDYFTARDAATPSNGTQQNNGVYESKTNADDKERAKEQKNHEAMDDIENNVSNATNNTSGKYNEKEFVEYLCPYANVQARKDNNTPQIPTSCIVGISVAITECEKSRSAKYNFWYLDNQAKLSTTYSTNAVGFYEFSDAYQGINAILQFLRKEEFKLALDCLKDKMWESTKEDKEKFRKILLTIMNNSSAQDSSDDEKGWITRATECIEKYNLYNWDTDKKESEGGHADTQPPASVGGKTNNALHDVMNQAIALSNTDSNKGSKGNAVDIQLVSPNNSTVNNNGMLRIVKLPKDKTLVEPIYPDFITVGDNVPEWIYSQAYAEAYKAAEEQALKEAGLSLEDDEISKKLSAANAAIDSFKEQQFKAWCVANNKPYSTDEEKAASLKEYNEIAATDKEHFTDGIYTPDASSKSTYKSLKQQQAAASYDSQNAATAKSHLRYTEDLQAVKAEIIAREGNWNQDRGQYIPSEQNDITLTNYGGSAVTGTGSYTATGGGTNAQIEKMVTWAINIANDQSHGYSQDSRTGNPDYDCSSLVYYALEQAGFPVITKRGFAGTTATIWDDLKSLGGWQEFSFSAGSVQRGDILWRDGHVAIATSATEEVAAHTWRNGSKEPGDQGTEISVNTRGNNYTKIFRCMIQADTATSGSSGPVGDIEAAVKFAESKAKGSYSQENRDGPSYDCSSLIYYALDAGGFSIIEAWKKNKRYSAAEPVTLNNGTVSGGYASKQKVGDVDTIWEDLQKTGMQGWQKLSWDKAKDNIKRGDIVAYWSNSVLTDGHVWMASNNTTTIEARSSSHGIGQWPISQRTPSYDVQEVYRYTRPANSTSSSVLDAIAKCKTAQKTSQIILVIGNESGKCSPCSVHLLEKNGSAWISKAQFSGKGGSNGFAYVREQGTYITPCGSFPIGDGFGFKEVPGGVTVTYRKLIPDYSFSHSTDIWGPHIDGNERMWEDKYKGSYDYGLVIGWYLNGATRAPGNTGGNIFYHCPSKPNGTGGCVAVDTQNVIRTLQWVKPGAYFLIVTKEADIPIY